MSISETLLNITRTLPARVDLIAVSKTVDEPRLREALSAGQKLFGENYVQEAKSKWPALKTEFPDIRLHLIGHLQSNKATDAVKLFDRIDTLDRVSLASALAKAMQKEGRKVPCLIQVNIGDEPQKGGVAEAELASLLDFARGLGIEVQGLMCIPPLYLRDASAPLGVKEGGATGPALDPKPYFEKLAALAKAYKLRTISMGMSADYEVAIACGATEVRIGSAIFGARSTKT